MRHNHLFFLAAALLIGCYHTDTFTRPPADRPALGLVTTVALAPGAEVSGDVVDECEVQSRLIGEIADEAGYHFSIRLLPDHEGVALPVLVLRFANIEAEGADMARFQSFDHGGGIDERAAAGVDQHHPRLHPRERVSIDHVARPGR